MEKKPQNTDNSLIFVKYTTAVYMFASVMCEYILCTPVCFCWQAKIFAAAHKVLQDPCICEIYL